MLVDLTRLVESPENVIPSSIRLICPEDRMNACRNMLGRPRIWLSKSVGLSAKGNAAQVSLLLPDDWASAYPAVSKAARRLKIAYCVLSANESIGMSSSNLILRTICSGLPGSGSSKGVCLHDSH